MIGSFVGATIIMIIFGWLFKITQENDIVSQKDKDIVFFTTSMVFLGWILIGCSLLASIWG